MTLTLSISCSQFADSLQLDEEAAREVYDAAWDALDVDDLPITRLDREWSRDGFSPSARINEIDTYPTDDERDLQREILARWARAVELASQEVPAPRTLNGERVVEYMPTYLRASHEAAGNSGSYPANGAVRVLVAATEEIEEDEWTSVVRPATAVDLTRYADATESDYHDGMGG